MGPRLREDDVDEDVAYANITISVRPKGHQGFCYSLLQHGGQSS